MGMELRGAGRAALTEKREGRVTPMALQLEWATGNPLHAGAEALNRASVSKVCVCVCWLVIFACLPNSNITES